MPTYEYECQTCHKTFECFQSMKDEAFKICPESCCQMETWGHGEVKRLIGTGAGLIFKGSGFYITDYRSDSYKSGEKKAQSSESGSTSSTSENSGASTSTSSDASSSKTLKTASNTPSAPPSTSA